MSKHSRSSSGLLAHQPLRGTAIILSASVPSADRNPIFHGIPLDHAQIEVEQATISVARAVFGAGGRIVWGGHPSITPILAVVSGEFAEIQAAEELPADKESRHSEARLVVYQSEAYEDKIPPETRLLAELRQADLRMTPMDKEERGKQWPKGKPKYPNSMIAMRREMISRPDVRAMVCIGGMEGVMQEAELFLETRPGLPVYALASTGGAARLLAGEARGVGRSRIRAVDENLMRGLELRIRRSGGKEEREESAPPRFVPYAVIAQEIVRELTG